jgi:sterol desaturase/sphingolipid hydroxylase (fatty acid hydroxylase superfamily)
MTAIIYFGEIFVASLLAVVLLANSPLGMTSASELFIGGVVVWTLVEYLVHRFVLHDFAPTRHGMHHANPDGPVLTIFWQIWACFALVYLIADGAFLAGTLVAYAWYLFVHHCAHHGPNNLPLSLLKHHKNHHRFASRNYGVSTTLWDHVFGTMLR